MSHANKVLKKLVRLNNSHALILPSDWVKALETKYVWLEQKGRQVTIKPAEVR